MKNKFYNEKEITFLKENIDKFGAEICAKKLGRTEKSVTSMCYRKIGHCKFVCNASSEEIENLEFENDFNFLDINFETTKKPKELAYFLGYFWADGYIRKDKCLVMEITKEDGDDIDKILSEIADFTIYERERAGRKPQKTFFYNDHKNEIPDKLISMGKYPKSLESHEKIINYIPEPYINYFFRGLIDGDGNLYTSPLISKHHNTQITIAGRSGQDWNYIIEFVKNKYGLSFKSQNRSHNEYKSSAIRATDKAKIVKFLEKIYNEDDGIYLTRKYNKIKELIKKE